MHRLYYHCRLQKYNFCIPYAFRLFRQFVDRDDLEYVMWSLNRPPVSRYWQKNVWSLIYIEYFQIWFFFAKNDDDWRTLTSKLLKANKCVDKNYDCRIVKSMRTTLLDLVQTTFSFPFNFKLDFNVGVSIHLKVASQIKTEAFVK